MPHHLGLDDHSALAPPRAGGVARLAVEVLGLATGLRAHAGAPHEPAAALDQPHIAGHRHDVLHALGVQEVQNLGTGKAPIEADAEDGSGEGDPQTSEQAPQERDRAVLGRAVAGPQDGGHQVLRRLGVERQRCHQRQVAPGVVMAVEEAELLLAMGRIVGRIQVECDATGAAPEPTAMVLDDQIRQGPRPSAPRRCSRRSHRRSRRPAAVPARSARAGPCQAAAGRSGSPPGARSPPAGRPGP